MGPKINQQTENFKSQSLEILRKVNPGEVTVWASAMEDMGDDPDRLKSAFADYMNILSKEDPYAIRDLDKVSKDFLDDLRGFSGKEKITTGAEKSEASKDSKDKPKVDSDKDRETVKIERAKRRKNRKIDAAVRDVKVKYLGRKKDLYKELSDAKGSKKTKIREKIAALDKESAEDQLKKYKEHGVDIDNPSKHFRDKIKALKKVIDPEKEKDEKDKKAPKLKELAKKMREAKKKMAEASEGIKLKAPKNPDRPTMDEIQANFKIVGEARANMNQVNAYIQASFADMSKVIKEAHGATKNSGLIDKLSSWTPWKTQTAKAVDSGTEKISEIKKRVESRFIPLIEDVNQYKDKVLDAAGALKKQTTKLHGATKGQAEQVAERKEKALAARKQNAEVDKQEREKAAELNVAALKVAHQKHLTRLRGQKTAITSIHEKQEALTDVQKHALDKYGNRMQGQMLRHDEAKMYVNQAIQTLKSRIPSLSGDAKAKAEEKLKALEGKTKELDAGAVAFDDKMKQMSDAKYSLVVAGKKLNGKVFNAILNLNDLENKSIADFAQHIAGVKRVFAAGEVAASKRVEVDLEALKSGFDEKIEMAKESHEVSGELAGEADFQYLDIEVSNIATMDNLNSQKEFVANTQEPQMGFWTSLGHTFNGQFIFDWFDVPADDWKREWLSFNPAMAIVKPLAKAIGEGGGYLNDNVARWFGYEGTMGEWWDESIDIMKNVRIPVLNRVADFTAGIADFAVDLVGGVAHMVLHPAQTMQGLGELVTSAEKLKQAGKAIIEYDEWGENTGFALGKVLGNVALTLTGVGAGGTAASAGARAAGVAGRIGKYSKVAWVARQPGLLGTAMWIPRNAGRLVATTVKNIPVFIRNIPLNARAMATKDYWRYGVRSLAKHGGRGMKNTGMWMWRNTVGLIPKTWEVLKGAFTGKFAETWAKMSLKAKNVKFQQLVKARKDMLDDIVDVSKGKLTQAELDSLYSVSVASGKGVEGFLEEVLKVVDDAPQMTDLVGVVQSRFRSADLADLLGKPLEVAKGEFGKMLPESITAADRAAALSKFETYHSGATAVGSDVVRGGARGYIEAMSKKYYTTHSRVVALEGVMHAQNIPAAALEESFLRDGFFEVSLEDYVQMARKADSVDTLTLRLMERFETKFPGAASKPEAWANVKFVAEKLMEEPGGLAFKRYLSRYVSSPDLEKVLKFYEAKGSEFADRVANLRKVRDGLKAYNEAGRPPLGDHGARVNKTYNSDQLISSMSDPKYAKAVSVEDLAAAFLEDTNARILKAWEKSPEVKVWNEWKAKKPPKSKPGKKAKSPEAAKLRQEWKDWESTKPTEPTPVDNVFDNMMYVEEARGLAQRFFSERTEQMLGKLNPASRTVWKKGLANIDPLGAAQPTAKGFFGKKVADIDARISALTTKRAGLPANDAAGKALIDSEISTLGKWRKLDVVFAWPGEKLVGPLVSKVVGFGRVVTVPLFITFESARGLYKVLVKGGSGNLLSENAVFWAKNKAGIQRGMIETVRAEMGKEGSENINVKVKSGDGEEDDSGNSEIAESDDDSYDDNDSGGGTTVSEDDEELQFSNES